MKSDMTADLTTDYTDFNGFHGETSCFLTDLTRAQQVSALRFITL